VTNFTVWVRNFSQPGTFMACRIRGNQSRRIGQVAAVSTRLSVLLMVVIVLLAPVLFDLTQSS